MNIENITVFGAGTVGSQIAFHAAFYGYKVVVFVVDHQAVEEAKERFCGIAKRYMQEVGAQRIEVDKAIGNLSYSVIMSEAIRNALFNMKRI